MNKKNFKEERPKKNMGRGYKTYLEAIRNCKSDEITIYNSADKLFYNVKVFPKLKKDIWRLGSEW